MADEDELWAVPLLRQIARSPRSYLGNENVRTLEVYIAGYARARSDLGHSREGLLLPTFAKWLTRKNRRRGTFGWASLIEREHPSTNNVGTFFRRFDEYLVETGREPLTKRP